MKALWVICKQTDEYYLSAYCDIQRFSILLHFWNCIHSEERKCDEPLRRSMNWNEFYVWRYGVNSAGFLHHYLLRILRNAYFDCSPCFFFFSNMHLSTKNCCPVTELSTCTKQNLIFCLSCQILRLSTNYGCLCWIWFSCCVKKKNLQCKVSVW